MKVLYPPGTLCPKYGLKIIKIKQKKGFSLSALSFPLAHGPARPLQFLLICCLAVSCYPVFAQAPDTHGAGKAGFKPDSLKLKRDSLKKKSLQDTVFNLKEVEVSTGYQTLPKERATGSFEVVDQKLFNRNISSNVLDRLDGLVAGATFKLDARDILADRQYFYPQTPFSMQIRGQNTFTGGSSPLVVLDDVIYEGDVRNLNPNDVEEVYMMKDAAATSIWGTRAGNGVVVIKTKHPHTNQETQIQLSSNFTVAQRPNLFALPEMNSSDFIDYEIGLYGQGFYDSMFEDTWNYPTLSPVVELLQQVKTHQLDSAMAWRQINSFRHTDVRNDYMRYLYRPQTRQQYALSLSGGTAQSGYLLSGGYDKNLNQLVTSDNDRITLRSVINLQPTRHLSLQSSLQYAKSVAGSEGTQSPVAYGTLYSGSGRTNWPYLRLADDNGNPLPVDAVPYRKMYRDTAGNGHLLNWDYVPLAELGDSRQQIGIQDLLLDLNARYKFSPDWSASLLYAYQKTSTHIDDWQGIGSFAARNTINIFSQWNDQAVLKYPVPVGDQMARMDEGQIAQTIRLQMDYQRRWGQQHELVALAGAENRQTRNTKDGHSLYGYDPDNLVYQPVDLASTYPLLNMPSGGQRITDAAGYFMDDLLNRYLSVFANASYTYRKRYTVSGSMRQDASNLFGQKSNQRWTPLWSAGLAWKLSDETFYRLAWLPYLNMRLTYGYSGQALSNQAAIPIIYHQGTSSLSGLPYATITAPPNPQLRWQKTGILNAAIDFRSRNGRITGSVEWYSKKAKDLLARAQTDPTTGFNNLTLNSAVVSGKGWDVAIHSLNLQYRQFSWQSDLLFSYNRDEVSSYYYQPSSASDYVTTGSGINPIEGKDLHALYAFPMAGLDHDTGDPLGYLNGQVSTDYSSILYSAAENLRYFGSNMPLYNSTLNNSFRYRQFRLSFHIQAKLDYYFFRQGFSDYNAAWNWAGHKDYAIRWQKPGDEAVTNVPSIRYPLDYYRSEFYTKSDALVVKGDHIRLQDLSLSYHITPRHYVKSLEVSAYVSNLNIILWRANKLGIDPLYGDALPYPRTFSIGVNANF